MFEELDYYLKMVLFLIPLGIVGIWRWSVWLIKRIISFFYKTPQGNLKTTLSIVTPVYNEDPTMFRSALQSWALSDPDEIIAVIDYSNHELVKIFKDFATSFPNCRLIVTGRPGKRAALADGIKIARSEIVALVDSDTMWEEDIKYKLTGPFEDASVGGLTTRQDVLSTDTLSRELFKMLLDDRYLIEYPFLSTISDALLCLSGRTAVYRKSAIVDKLDDLENETFWGQKMISGDDKTLTNLIHASGWSTRFLRDVKVYTPGVEKLGDFFKQKLRWARNGLRSDSRVLMSGWIWRRHKFLALYMIDKVLAAITILLSPIYFTVALLTGQWLIATIILIWWVISRSIKIFPHLKEKPSDVFLLPVYILMTFVMSLIKIYAFFTIDKQGWITRWDKKRLSWFGPVRYAFSIFLTVMFIGAYFFVVASYEYKVLATKKDSVEVQNIISREPRIVTASELEIKKENITNDSNSSYGYYYLKPGDMLYTLKDKFNLSSISFFTYEDGSQIVNPNNVAAGKKIKIPTTEMRNSLNAERLLNSTYIFPRINYDQQSDTIFVRGSGSVVTLSRIKRAIGQGNRGLEQLAKGEWILRSNLYIGKNVTLVVDKSDVDYLKLKSDGEKNVWLRSQNGNILISNTKVSSWDETSQSPDIDLNNGRSYITAKSSGRMDVLNSDIGYLGYVGSPRRGGEFGGSYGLSWKITSGKINDNLLTGSVINSSIHDNYFGIYTFGATGLTIKNNDVFHNVEYGIDPHDDSNNLLIAENRVYENGNHGIILSKRCFNNIISSNASYNNKLHGIMLDRNSNNNVVVKNEVYGNVDGIALYDSDRNLITENNIKDNKQGIRLNNTSEFNYIENNSVTNNSTGMHVYGGSNNNIAVNNKIAFNKLALSIQNAFDNIFYGNFKSFENTKDGNISAELLTKNEIKY